MIPDRFLVEYGSILHSEERFSVTIKNNDLLYREGNIDETSELNPTESVTPVKINGTISGIRWMILDCGSGMNITISAALMEPNGRFKYPLKTWKLSLRGPMTSQILSWNS
jgi:hypothetical protein